MLIQPTPSLPRDIDFADLNDILENERIVSCFQPILSTKLRAVLGFEALSRGCTPNGETLSPLALFSAARRYDRTIELDRLCRIKAMEKFRSLRSGQEREDSLLFINFDTSLLDSAVAGSGVLRAQAARMGIPPGRIVIEIVESAVKNTAALKEFIQFYRREGFLIAIDDVGAGYSNFDRITIIKPDILKIDRSIISSMEKDYTKQEIFKAIVNLSSKIGTLVLAEGVETAEEVLCALDCGADLLQGFFFSGPQQDPNRILSEIEDKICLTADRLRKCRIEKVRKIRREYRTYDDAIVRMLEILSRAGSDAFEAILKSRIADFDFIDAVYILDTKGLMITGTVTKGLRQTGKETLFRRAVRGDDLSLKEYFYLLISTGLNRYVTRSYISLATGNLTRTISTCFRDLQGNTCVLCVDIQQRD